MKNFFRTAPRSLVVLVLVSALFIGPVFGAESGTLPPAPDTSSDVSEPDGPMGGESLTVSGSDVTVNVEKHDTLSVVSVPVDVQETPSGPADGSEAPTLADTIRSLFGSYTPRTQTVTTYYDGQPIATEEQIIPGLAGLDFEWLVGVGMFALVTFCLFRLLGGVLRHG